MFVELLEKLRCPNDHELSPLIATASKTVNRHILEGTLGCPVCHAEFRVHEGAVELGGSSTVRAPIKADLSDERMMRIGALLGLDERGGLYVLDAISLHFARAFIERSPSSHFIALATEPDVDGASGVLVGHGETIPLAPGCVRGIALDFPTPKLLRAAVQALAAGGRLVAPAGANVPDGVTELARDDDEWVAERDAVPALLDLRRAGR
ncbi:MAG TPA: hypothetical protein VGI97_10450 [Gemmatimonadaceae bacterium]|jgi:uncharacterized protein YbaR (Trm112 family)